MMFDDLDYEPTHDAGEDPYVQIDVYGIKVKAGGRPVADQTTPPRTWREVASRINRHLMEWAVAPFAIVAAVADATQNLLRGLPAMFTRRVEQSHSEADRREEKKQQEELLLGEREKAVDLLPAPTEDSPVEENARDQFERLKVEFKDKGIEVEIREMPDGNFSINMGSPDGIEAVVDAVMADYAESERDSEGNPIESSVAEGATASAQFSAEVRPSNPGTDVDQS